MSMSFTLDVGDVLDAAANASPLAYRDATLGRNSGALSIAERERFYRPERFRRDGLWGVLCGRASAHPVRVRRTRCCSCYCVWCVARCESADRRRRRRRRACPPCPRADLAVDVSSLCSEAVRERMAVTLDVPPR
jgi:hypothetical protein